MVNMVIQPKVKGFICITAHPVGCYKIVEEQINYVKSKGKFKGPKRVLVIGASTGYGLASRIVSAFGCDADTIGVFFEREADEKRTASAGWYNSAAFEKIAHQEKRYAKSINGDAFSQDVKQRVVDLIRKDLQQVDLVVYSLAAPKRVHPDGKTVFSTLKPIGRAYTSKTIDAFRGEVKEVTLQPATEEEIANTVAVMGGEDWEMWMDFLAKENVLAKGVTTVAYTYLGPQLTYPIYKEGTIGRAKEHLRITAEKLNQKLKTTHEGRALLSVNKALVTQASSAIPVVPLYISLLYKIMKENGTHEGCIEQMYRLFKDYLYASQGTKVDAQELVRVDDLEMRREVQEKITALWPQAKSENLSQLADVKGYCDDFYRLFGFNVDGVNYNAEVDPHERVESI